MNKIELSEKCRKRIIKEIEKSRFYETAEYVGEYKGYMAFGLGFLDPESAGCYGLPEYLLVKDPFVRKATIEENKEILATVDRCSYEE